MDSLNPCRRIVPLFLLFGFVLSLSGCAEVHTLFSVLWNGATSLSTSAFEVDEVKSGTKVTCMTLGDKTLRCLGSGTRGNLGRFNGTPVTNVKDVKQIALGKGFTCAIIGEKGEVFCFGNNDKGQLGNPKFLSTIEPVPVLDGEAANAPLVDAKQITAGEKHACALLKNGRAVCWGDNSYGQAGNSAETIGVKSVLELPNSPKPFVMVHGIYAGVNSTCIIAKEDFSAYCFGEKFGINRKFNWMPEKIDLAGSIGSVSKVKSIGLGRGFGCALLKSSQVLCWGRNDLNQLGALVNLPGMTKATSVMVTYPEESAIAKVDSLAVGENHACALHRDEKTLFCWGDNRFGQLGSTSIRGVPEQVALGSNNLTLKGVRGVSVGPDRTCIVSSRDEVFCWGNGAHGILGSEKVISAYPVRALDANGEMLSGATQIGVGTDHTCIIDTAQKMYCFGVNEFGQLGSKNVSGPVTITDGKAVSKVIAIDTFGSRTCMVYGDDQSVACFGDREIDNINKKYEINSFTPEEVRKGMNSFKGAMGVAAGKSHVCVITGEQTVECVGDGSKGQLGGDVESQSFKFSVVQTDKKIPLKDVWQVRSKQDFTCALRQESGSVWCWGEWSGSRVLTARQLLESGRPSADFIQLSLSEDQVCGVHGIDRALFCTSSAEKFADKLEFLPMLTVEGHPIKKVLAISGGGHHQCAIDEEGKLYCWGSNQAGQLGVVAPKESLKAIRVDLKQERLKKVSRVSAGDQHTCVATRDDPSLFCFGESFFGGTHAPEAVEYPL